MDNPTFGYGTDGTLGYSDEQAQLVQRVEALEALARPDRVTSVYDHRDEIAQLLKRIVALETALAALKAAVERQAEYQGVKHLLAPQ